MSPGGFAGPSNAMFPWPRRLRSVRLPPNSRSSPRASGNLYRVMVKFCPPLSFLWNANAVYV